MSEDHEARLQVLKLEFAEQALFLRDFMAALPIPVGFELADNLEASAETLMHAAELIGVMPGLAPSVAMMMRKALQRTMGAMFAMAWFAARGGDWAEMNTRLLLLEAGKALRIAGLGLVADGGDGEVQG